MKDDEKSSAWSFKAGVIALATGLVISNPMTTFGQSTGPSSSGESFHSGVNQNNSSGTALSPQTTQIIVRNIESVRSECGRYDPVYRIDCLRQGLDNVARRIPGGGDYGRARSLILRASAKLNTIVRQHADNQAPKLDSAPGANPRFRAKRRYTAVKKTELKVAMQKANAVMDELKTELLRSSENSQNRLQHYQQIATAVGSTKVLLRS